jgi:lysophospholipase L1-like esterase
MIEAGLSGRTTTFDDPGEPGRNGLTGLGPVLALCPPLAMVILMLGTNDLKNHLDVSATDTAQVIHRLIEVIEKHAAKPRMKWLHD